MVTRRSCFASSGRPSGFSLCVRARVYSCIAPPIRTRPRPRSCVPFEAGAARTSRRPVKTERKRPGDERDGVGGHPIRRRAIRVQEIDIDDSRQKHKPAPRPHPYTVVDVPSNHRARVTATVRPCHAHRVFCVRLRRSAYIKQIIPFRRRRAIASLPRRYCHIILYITAVYRIVYITI